MAIVNTVRMYALMKDKRVVNILKKVLTMKEIKLYQCEICNTQYNDEKRARECENNHTALKRTKKCRYVQWSKYPETIEIEFKDGKTAVYFKGKEF